MTNLLLQELKSAHENTGMSFFTITYSKPKGKWQIRIDRKVFLNEDVNEVIVAAINYIYQNRVELPWNKYTMLKNHNSLRD